MQRLLLDTHVFLWWLADDERLGSGARSRIAEPRNVVFVSAATGWEIGIKKGLGKLTAPDNLDALVEDEGFTHLPISFFHGEQVATLPDNHRDPFDRILIAQAQAEGLMLITNDAAIKDYPVRIVDAMG